MRSLARRALHALYLQTHRMRSKTGDTPVRFLPTLASNSATTCDPTLKKDDQCSDCHHCKRRRDAVGFNALTEKQCGHPIYFDYFIIWITQSRRFNRLSPPHPLSNQNSLVLARSDARLDPPSHSEVPDRAALHTSADPRGSGTHPSIDSLLLVSDRGGFAATEKRARLQHHRRHVSAVQLLVAKGSTVACRQPTLRHLHSRRNSALA